MKKLAVTKTKKSMNRLNILLHINSTWVFKTVAILVGCVILSSVSAQNCSQNTIRQADGLYKQGNFERVQKLLEPCIGTNGFIDDEERFSGLKMLANIELLNYDFEKANEYIVQLLEINATYSPNKNDESLQFISTVKLLKGNKLFSQFDALVISASKREQLASDAPATIHVVSKEDISARGYTNLLELLEDIPSVEVQRNSMNEFKNVVGIRGISGNEKFMIMMDGIRITPATGDPYALNQNYSLINAKRVEVILGPASALYGVDAFSGIINIITKDGIDIDGGNLNVSFGQYNTTDNSFAIGKNSRGIDFSVAGEFYHTDEPDYQNIYPEEYSWYNDVYQPDGLMGDPFDVNARVVPKREYDRKFEMPTRTYFLTSKLKLGDFEIGGSTQGTKHGSGISTDPRASIYTNESFLSTSMQTAYFQHVFLRKLDNNSRSWSLQSTATMTNYQMDPSSSFVNYFTGYGQGYKYTYSKSQKIEEQFDYDFSSKLSFIGGASYELLSSLPKTSDTPSPVNKNIPTDNQDLFYSGSVLSGDSIGIPLDFYYLNYWNFGSFAQFQYKPSDLFEMTLGTRYDYNSRYTGSLNPRLGIVIKPSDKIKLKLLYGRAFLAPSPWKAYVSFGSFKEVPDVNGEPSLAADFFHLPNPNLMPEKLNSLESSFTWLPNDRSKLVVGAYYNEIQDLISLQEINQEIKLFKGVPIDLVETTKNEGGSITYGLTIHTVLQLLKTENRGIKIYTSYDYSDGHVEILQSDGSFDKKDLPLSAKHTFKSGLDFNFNRLTGSIRYIFRSKSNSVKTLRPDPNSQLDSSNNEFKHKAFGVINLFAKYRLNDKGKYKWSTFIKVNNLLNSRYYNVSGATDSFSATPQDPIRISGGVNLDF
ncbi:MAG: outer membrane receptor protein involved in Fe transport [Saprospiraceae bacterium]|jgi:iron complex outermembrane receptor protein